MKIKITNVLLEKKKNNNNINNNEEDKFMEEYVWVTGGHSAAAGHGNLHSQTFTYTIEKLLKPIFQSAHISFKGKNYAMGGTSSGPEVSVCGSQIFGTNIDAIYWDYGMIDGRADYLYDLWANRFGLHPTSPTLFDGHNKKKKYSHKEIHESYELHGLSAFHIDYNVVNKNIPLSTGPNAVDKNTLTEALYGYMCEKGIEANTDTICKPLKFDTERFCPNYRKYQVSWHNGWKDHLFMGYTIALFLADEFVSAVKEVIDEIPNESIMKVAYITMFFLVSIILLSPSLREEISARSVSKLSTQFSDAKIEESIENKFPTLLKSVLSARKNLDATVSKIYGNENGPAIFNRDDILSAFLGKENERNDNTTSLKNHKSLYRLKRRMKIKITNVLLEKKKNNNNINNNEEDKFMEEYVWVTGGHSAAAGHGNLHSQTFTYTIEKLLKPIFQSAHISFKGKNYAMGGTSSGPEVSVCGSQIFGTNIDAIYWDYGMIDGRADYLYDLWANRFGLHPTSPTLFDGHNKKKKYSHKEIHESYELHGLSAFHIDYNVVNKNIPLSTGPNAVDKNTLTEALYGYMCEKGIEANTDTICKPLKFDTERFCPNYRKYQVSWHNGWKDHLFMGYTIALFLADEFVSAVKEVIDEIPNESKGGEDNNGGGTAYLNRLVAEEQNDRRLFEKASSAGLVELETNYEDDDHTVDSVALSKYSSTMLKIANITAKVYRRLLRSPSIMCRTSLLPAESRFEGIVHDPQKTSSSAGTYVDGGRYVGYDLAWKGHGSEPNLIHVQTSDTKLCPDLMELDSKDYFQIKASNDIVDGIIRIPSRAETIRYGHGTYKERKRSMIMICTVLVDNGNYPKNYVHVSEVVTKKEGKIRRLKQQDEKENARQVISNNLRITVSGREVTGVAKLSGNCFLLKHDVDDNGDDASAYEFQMTSEYDDEGKKDSKEWHYHEIKIWLKEGKEFMVSSIAVIYE